MKLEPATIPVQKDRVEYEDDAYQFVEQDYGGKGELTPGFFAFSKRHKTWMKIMEISTTSAKLGSSRNLPMISVTWDWSRLASQPFVQLPLMTSGSIAFPNRITFDQRTGYYRMEITNGDFATPDPTEFLVLKADIDSAFAASSQTVLDAHSK